MVNTLSKMRRALAGLAAAVLFLSSAVYGEEGNERAQLRERERKARERIELLRRQQDFLLFQKNLFAADSKYLVLDLRAGRGMLNYRNRILRSFRFTVAGTSVSRGVAPGMFQLTSKLDGGPRTRQLIFGDSRLIVQGKNARFSAGKGTNPVRIRIGSKDLGALFYVLEQGSMAYVTDGSFTRTRSASN